jgi:hypothetical protein
MVFELIASRTARFPPHGSRLRTLSSRWPARLRAWRRYSVSAVRDAKLEHSDVLAHAAWIGCAILVGWTVLAAPAPKALAASYETARLLALTRGDLSDQGMRAVFGLDPAAALIAQRLAPLPPHPLGDAGGPETRAAESLLNQDLPGINADQARAINASIPVSKALNPAAKPFFLPAGGLLDQTRAIDCLTAAVYYEAASEPLVGQQAVAQVVLNRMRHPAFPKTVCGVVFEGSNRSTGCQFTFTCDGSLARMPNAAAWRRAREVAAAALSGFVLKDVGDATHYHADYVVPYWATSLTKIGKFGTQIFYRWNGQWGAPGAFHGAYAGVEPNVDVSGGRDPNLDQALADAAQIIAAGAAHPTAFVQTATRLPLPAEMAASVGRKPMAVAAVGVVAVSAPTAATPQSKPAEDSDEIVKAGPLWERR